MNNSLEIMKKHIACEKNPCLADNCVDCKNETTIYERLSAMDDAVLALEMVDDRIKEWVKDNRGEAISVHKVEDHDCGECPFCAFPDCWGLMDGKEMPDGTLADIVNKIKSREGIE